MQSQQKKVKWSRGETADALEERTDTGITQVSVSKMENIIADVYGNISRRPAFKIISSVVGATDFPVILGSASITNSSFVRPPQSFVFTIDENTYIIFIAGSTTSDGFGGFLIQNNKFIRRITINNTSGYSLNFIWSNPISSAQYNNFMIVGNLYQKDVIIRLSGTDITDYAVNVEQFIFSAPWYAPNGTTTTQVTSTEVPGLNFDSSSIGQYTYTEASGETTVYSWIDTGISSGALSAVWTGETTTFSFIGMTQNGPSSVPLSTVTMTNGTTYSDQQVVGTIPWFVQGIGLRTRNIVISLQGHKMTLVTGLENEDVSSYMTANIPTITGYIPLGSIVQFPNNGAYMRVEGFDSDGHHLRMYGAFLTPVASDSAHDDRIKIETGYVSLNGYEPKLFTFSNQRLYAASFTNTSLSPQVIPGYTIGSQVARYTDFKNDYNTQSEAVPIDISTSYQEEIVAIVDYNGLKIFTNAAEYAYSQQSGVLQQSKHGSLKTCKPLVFGSVCLYSDKSGRQIRALQYELQTNLFNSSTINQMSQEDLIFNTTTLGGFIDKKKHTGHFLFATQTGYNRDTLNWTTPIANHSLAICNFVPGNQAEIWSRWTSPEIKISNYNRHSISNIIEINNKVWFVVGCSFVATSSPDIAYTGYTIAELDYTDDLDYQVSSIDTKYKIKSNSGWYITIPNATVSVFDGDQYKWDDTLDQYGNYTKSLADLTNPRVGFMINATLESHPIDIQGKTYTEKKRIGKCVAVIRDTEPGTFTVCDKTGYTGPDKKTVNFYGCTGMKDQVRYTIKNIKGAKFTIESLTMIIEYGTLDS